MMLGCVVDYYGALDWVKQNADNIDDIADLEATHTFCCARFTPLDMSVIAGRRDLVAKLIAKGVKTDNLEHMLLRSGWKAGEIIDICYSGSGKTPGFDILQLAVKQTHLPALTRLLDSGGDPNSREIRDENGTTRPGATLFDIAVSNGYL